MQKLPLGYSTLEQIRNNDCIYVDKTKLIKDLAEGSYYFLSQPRRFGKSLLINIIKQALFTGLYSVIKDWD